MLRENERSNYTLTIRKNWEEHRKTIIKGNYACLVKKMIPFLGQSSYLPSLKQSFFLCIMEKLRGERMLKPKSRWIIQQTNKDKSSQLSSMLNITPLMATLLINRGLDTYEAAEQFLYCEKYPFHDPFLLTGMNCAVTRIKEAIEKEEPILIYGDYDADGVTSTSVLMITLRDLGANVHYYIPNRFTEGYGPNENAFRKAKQQGIRLIITVDTGISAIQEAKLAKELGMDLIISDHHEIGTELPEALAIIHPRLENGSYPFPDLSGVGVAFKIAHALYGKVPEHLLDLVAIGTIADLVPLKGENRLIVKKGLVQLRKTNRAGLQSLIEMSGIIQESIDEDTVGYVIGPRINAVGRLDHVDPVVRLLLTDDKWEAREIAEEIEKINRKRQELVSRITKEAISEVEEKYPISDNPVIVVGKEDWNEGVIGIVAAKLVEKYYRPVVCLSIDKEKGVAKGSARSINGFHLHKNLSECKDLLLNFGGHQSAAGMTLEIKNIESLRERLNDLAKQKLTEEDFQPSCELDGEIDLKDISIQTIEELEKLAPFGMGNPRPKFLVKESQIASIRKIGANEDHLKIVLENDNAQMDCVGFGFGDLYDKISPFSKLSVIGELFINEWNNFRRPQIFLEDMKIDDWQLFDYRGFKEWKKLKELIPHGKWIIFNEELYEKLSFNDPFILINTLTDALQLELTDEDVFLFDLPTSMDLLEALFAGKYPSRVYVYFYSESSNYFRTLPTRDHFKWYYRFLANKSPFDLKKYGVELAKYRGWTRESIEFMSKVFLELDFIYMKDGLVFLNKNPQKKDLTDSITFQKKQAHYILEKELLYSSPKELKESFDRWIRGSKQIEEAVNS